MPDREKIIEEFEHLLNAAKGNYQDFVDLTVDGGEEILALLKEQEPTKSTYESLFGDIIAQCSDGYIVRYEYCPMCGQVVKQDG